MKLLIATILACAALLIAALWQIAPQWRTAYAPSETPAVIRSVPPIDVALPAPRVQADPASAESPTTLPTYEPPTPVRWPDATAEIERRFAAAREAALADPLNDVALHDAFVAGRALQRVDDLCDLLVLRVRADPEDIDMRFELATELMRLGRWATATTQLRELVRRRPQHATAWYNLAVAHQALGQLSDARHAWDRVLEFDPDSSAARSHRAEIALDLHDWAAAASDLEIAQRDEPADAGLAMNLALAYWRLERPADALRVMNSLVESNPNFVPALNRLAEFAFALYREDAQRYANQRELAVTWAERSLAIDANQPLIRGLLAAAAREK